MTTWRSRLAAAMCVLGGWTLAVSALAGVNSVTLQWTAPGDDGRSGRATRYDLRYSLSPFTVANFDSADVAPVIPAPAQAGTRQRVVVSGLEPDQLYYFALKAVDDAGNWSAMAVASFRTSVGPTRPAVTPALSLSAAYPSPTKGRVQLDMTLPRAMPVRVVVIDVSGRLLTWLASGDYPAGTSTLGWDLADARGARVDAGQYWVVADFGSTRFTRQLTVVP